MIIILFIVLIFLVEVPIYLRKRAKLDKKRFEREELHHQQQLVNARRAELGRRLPPPDSRQRVG